jgi:hypothetical protein
MEERRQLVSVVCKICESDISKSVKRGEKIFIGTCLDCQAQEDLDYTPTGLPNPKRHRIDRGFDNRLPKMNTIDPFEHEYKLKARQKPQLRKFKDA